jgi:3'-phosphoadenosine 5'-phosphosulfate sulfotransferase (PAPS reductase)/FAD synthetase
MHEPLATWVRANGEVATTLRLTGTRAKQKKATSKMAADAPLPSTPEYQALAPIFDWTEESALRCLTDAGVPLWDGYSRGLNRTACWLCPGQRPSAYAALRREYPCLFRAVQSLEERVGAVRFWEVKLAGGTVAEAADRGDQMLAAKGVAKGDDGEAELAEEAAGDAPLGITRGRAGEQHDGARATGPRKRKRSARPVLDSGRQIETADNSISPQASAAPPRRRARAGQAAKFLGTEPLNTVGAKVRSDPLHPPAVHSVRAAVPPARRARQTTTRKDARHR